MRYPASEKLGIIRLVEESALPVRRTLEKIGIPPATFYRWYDLYQAGGLEALNDRHPKPDRVWNRIPDDVRERIIRLALDEPALSPREFGGEPFGTYAPRQNRKSSAGQDGAGPNLIDGLSTGWRKPC